MAVGVASENNFRLSLRYSFDQLAKSDFLSKKIFEK
jgi:hypothetical protein